jgi:hypothetical protein
VNTVETEEEGTSHRSLAVTKDRRDTMSTTNRRCFLVSLRTAEWAGLTLNTLILPTTTLGRTAEKELEGSLLTSTLTDVISF